MELSSQSIIKFLHRFHGILFAVFVLGGLIFIIFTLNGIINSTAPKDTVVAPVSSGFDQATIDQLNALRSPGEQPAPLNTSGGRTNPFVE